MVQNSPKSPENLIEWWVWYQNAYAYVFLDGKTGGGVRITIFQSLNPFCDVTDPQNNSKMVRNLPKSPENLIEWWVWSQNAYGYGFLDGKTGGGVKNTRFQNLDPFVTSQTPKMTQNGPKFTQNARKLDEMMVYVPKSTWIRFLGRENRWLCKNSKDYLDPVCDVIFTSDTNIWPKNTLKWFLNVNKWSDSAKNNTILTFWRAKTSL